MRRFRPSFLLTILIWAVLLSGKSEGAEQPTTVETPKRSPIVPKKAANTSNPQAERETKEKAAAEELARQKELAAKELKHRRETDQKQIEIQDNIATFTGYLVVVGFLQVGVAVVGLGAIWVLTNPPMLRRAPPTLPTTP